MLLILILLLLLFGGGGWYGGNRAYPGWGGPGFGIGAVLIILLIWYLLSGHGLSFPR
jgi:hypothetical protein